MANLIKCGARKPRIENGNIWRSNSYDPARGGMTYELTVAAGIAAGKPQYRASLSEDEMLETIADWLGQFGRVRRQRIADAKKAAKNAA